MMKRIVSELSSQSVLKSSQRHIQAVINAVDENDDENIFSLSHGQIQCFSRAKFTFKLLSTPWTERMMKSSVFGVLSCADNFHWSRGHDAL